MTVTEGGDEALADLAPALAALKEAREKYGWMSPEAKGALNRLCEAERDLARRRNLPYVVPIDLGILWEPNAPSPVLFQVPNLALLVIRPHYDDADQRPIVFRWHGCAGAFLTPPSDEGQHLIPLQGAGFAECFWGAEVFNSPWIGWWLGRFDRHLRHFLLIFHDEMFHAFARAVSVERLSLAGWKMEDLLSDPLLLDQLTRPLTFF